MSAESEEARASFTRQLVAALGEYLPGVVGTESLARAVEAVAGRWLVDHQVGSSFNSDDRWDLSDRFVITTPWEPR